LELLNIGLDTSVEVGKLLCVLYERKEKTMVEEGLEQATHLDNLS